MLNNILRRFLATISGRTQPQSRRRTLAMQTHPQLEMLEDRLTPSTLTVTTNADSGLGSLRYAITHAGSGDTIVFAPSVHAITLTGGELVINKNLSILGPGASQLTVSGGDASRVFDIEAGKVTLAGLNIANGRSSGPLPSSMVGVYSGAGTGAGGGGGILNEAGANLTLSNDTVEGNQALHGPSTLAFTVLGGGLLNLGTTTMLGCVFSNNQAEGGNGVDAIGGSAGGAVDNFGNPGGGAMFTAGNCTFSNNSAVGAGGGYFFGIGGALESDAGLNGFDPTQAEPSSATLTGCTFLTNLATGGPNALANGGALVNEGVGVYMKLVGCTINGNRSVGGGGGDGITTGDSQGIGGGILSAAGTLNIVGCTITNNLALGGNNAIISDGDTLASSAFGGGIENNSDDVLNISDSLIANNTAQGGAMTTNPGPGGDAVGGGITNSPSATMVMTNCVVANNSAIAGHGGAGVNSSLTSAQAGFAFGGGVDSSRGSTATISGSLITGNSAVGGAGGAGNNGGDGYGGGLSVGFGTLAGFGPDGSQLTLVNSVVIDNEALGGMGGAGANGGDGLGGGLAVTASCSATVTDSQIDFNNATGGHKGVGGQTGDGIGGGVYNDLGTFTDLLTAIADNLASTSYNNIF